MQIKQISVREARDLLQGDGDYVYLDVRSEFEFQQGHPDGALNIPLKQLNTQYRVLEDNPEFLAVVESNFPRDANLLLGCAVGQRSNMAGMILAQAGYLNLANIDGGFGGAKDMMGNLLKEGWVQAEFPVETGDGGEAGYQALKKKCEMRSDDRGGSSSIAGQR